MAHVPVLEAMLVLCWIRMVPACSGAILPIPQVLVDGEGVVRALVRQLIYVAPDIDWGGACEFYQLEHSVRKRCRISRVRYHRTPTLSRNKIRKFATFLFVFFFDKNVVARFRDVYRVFFVLR